MITCVIMRFNCQVFFANHDVSGILSSHNEEQVRSNLNLEKMELIQEQLCL